MPVPKIAETALQRFTELEPYPQPTVVNVKHPVVLMHGFGMLASLRRQGHLHAEAMNLRLHGVPAFAPNVSPYDTVSMRAAMWEKRLEHVLEEAEADRANLVAHSMGGLDARYLISVTGRHDLVASLTTISTPHHGSAIAQILLDQPERLREIATAFVDWFGTTALADATSNAEQALAELTPSHLDQDFNPAVPDHPDVRYWSFAGVAGKDTEVSLNPFMRLLNRMLYRQEGKNDGFVSVESARWGEFLGTVEADHAQQVGIRSATSGPFDSNEFYLDVARRLADAGL